MMNFLTYIMGFFMNFELLPIMQIRKKGGWNLKKIFSSETAEPIKHKVNFVFDARFTPSNSD